MRDRDEFASILKSNVPKKYWNSFLGNVPRKGQNVHLPRRQGPDVGVQLAD